MDMNEGEIKKSATSFIDEYSVAVSEELIEEVLFLN